MFQKFLTIHARAGTHVQTFVVVVVCFYTRAPLGLLNSFRCTRRIARVHRRKERRHALLKEEEEEEEVEEKRLTTHHTHLKTENESIKRDERERIGHHADRTASVQVCV